MYLSNVLFSQHFQTITNGPQKNHGVKKDEYFTKKRKSPRNKAMSLAILTNSVQELSGKNEYLSVNSRTIIKLVLEKIVMLIAFPRK